MKAIKRLIVMALATSTFFSCHICSAQNATTPVELDPQYKLNEQNVMGLVWMRSSGEYRALCYQAYNAALRAVEDAVKNSDDYSKPLAFVVDCDETILNGMAFNSTFVGTPYSYSYAIFNDWVRENRDVAIPGAVDLLNKIDELGVSIFYVSNRSEDVREESQKNLLNLGFPQVDSDHVLFLKKGDHKKLERRAAIVEKYHVVAYMGDSMTDFPLSLEEKGFEEAKHVADIHSEEFGTEFIILPNPVYGSWESALKSGYNKLSPEEKEQVRKEHLKN